MKGTTQVIKLKNMRAPPESFETECMVASGPKEGEVSQGNRILGGGGGDTLVQRLQRQCVQWCLKLCSHEQLYQQLFSRHVFLQTLPTQSTSMWNRSHMKTFERADFDLFTHQKSGHLHRYFFDLVWGEKFPEKLLMLARLEAKRQLKWSELSSQGKVKFCK